ncbi:hypothetical protein [Pseudomonas sp. UW4]|uniref:SpaN/EivJ family type III secretion system needle length determinant n=1 Tax=Pseudomonas sp. UW4 TaxID=1207075 RepID=UPI00029D27BE|nr:hypothetical protein [Pseudomonas sp. UW4]AFY20822.1 invasion protein [Pseudomonas sp. UW4]
MSNVSVISPLPVQPLDPVTEQPMDESHDRLVPVREDELPQGVLELMAPLILRHRPLMDTGRAITLQAMVTLPEKPAAELDEVRPLAPVSHPQAQPLSSKPEQLRVSPPASHPQAQPLSSKPEQLRVSPPVSHPQAQSLSSKPEQPLVSPPASHPQAQPLLSKPVPPRLLPAVADVAPVVDRGGAQTSTLTPTNLPTRIVVEPGPTERPSNIVEALPVERAASPGAPSMFEFEGQRPEALSNLLTARHVPPIASPAASAPGMPPAPPALDPIIETLPVADRGLLQVPFNKGAASGQVTISRVVDEPTRNLQISPSNALVFEQLKVSLEHVREPAWRLTDSDGEQQRQGSRQPPDDEQTEDAGQGA